MLYLALCTEGENSEPAFIQELARVVNGQSTNQKGVYVSIITVPLRGVHGHTKIFQSADAALLEREQQPDDPLSDFSNTEDMLEKWLICDYDKMEKHGLTIDQFREMATSSGYNLVLSRPNFEYFVLALLIGVDAASRVAPKNYTRTINDAIDKINRRNQITKHFSESMQIPKYSKRAYAAPFFFGKLLDYNKELLTAFCNSSEQPCPSNNFSEMSKIIKRIQSLQKS